MRAVAFDLDGCLVESRGAILPSIRVALTQHRLPALPDDEIAFLIGPPLETGFEELLTRLGEDVALALPLVHAYRADYREHMLERTRVMTGMDDVVRAVAERRTICVVTSKPKEMAAPILEHLGLLDAFAFVEGPSLQKEAETKVETLGRALERLEIGVMVGDRHHDVDAGRAHGLTTVGVLWGMGDVLELGDADHLVSTPVELVGLLT